MSLNKKIEDRTGKSYLSYSAVKYALQDMRLFELYMQGKLNKKTDALTFGSMYDCMLFTPNDFDKRFYVLDDAEVCAEIGGKMPRSTKKYKDWLQEAQKPGLEQVTQDEVQQAIDMINRLDESGVRELYLTGQYQAEFNQEVETEWNGNVMCKGFLDCLGEGYISDSKTTMNAIGFRYDVRKYHYDIQAYLYTHVYGLDEFYWVVQEKIYPYLPAVYKASEETLHSGRQKWNKGIETIASFFDADKRSETHYLIDII